MNLRNLITIHRPSVAAFTRDTAQALGILAAVAAVTDWATERLLIENYRLRAENSRLHQALRLGATLDAGERYELTPSPEALEAAADKIDAALYGAIYGSQRVPLHPSLITPLCEEFGREIDTRIKDVVEEWSA